jgi:hypothetical protein
MHRERQGSSKRSCVSCGPVSVQVLPQIAIKDALTVQLEVNAVYSKYH